MPRLFAELLIECRDADYSDMLTVFCPRTSGTAFLMLPNDVLAG